MWSLSLIWEKFSIVVHVGYFEYFKTLFGKTICFGWERMSQFGSIYASVFFFLLKMLHDINAFFVIFAAKRIEDND